MPIVPNLSERKSFSGAVVSGFDLENGEAEPKSVSGIKSAAESKPDCSGIGYAKGKRKNAGE
jgi:hypothetical protein